MVPARAMAPLLQCILTYHLLGRQVRLHADRARWRHFLLMWFRALLYQASFAAGYSATHSHAIVSACVRRVITARERRRLSRRQYASPHRLALPQRDVSNATSRLPHRDCEKANPRRNASPHGCTDVQQRIPSAAAAVYRSTMNAGACSSPSKSCHRAPAPGLQQRAALLEAIRTAGARHELELRSRQACSASGSEDRISAPAPHLRPAPHAVLSHGKHSTTLASPPGGERTGQEAPSRHAPGEEEGGRRETTVPPPHAVPSIAMLSTVILTPSNSRMPARAVQHAHATGTSPLSVTSPGIASPELRSLLASSLMTRRKRLSESADSALRREQTEKALDPLPTVPEVVAAEDAAAISEPCTPSAISHPAPTVRSAAPPSWDTSETAGVTKLSSATAIIDRLYCRSAIKKADHQLHEAASCPSTSRPRATTEGAMSYAGEALLEATLRSHWTCSPPSMVVLSPTAAPSPDTHLLFTSMEPLTSPTQGQDTTAVDVLTSSPPCATAPIEPMPSARPTSPLPTHDTSVAVLSELSPSRQRPERQSLAETGILPPFVSRRRGRHKSQAGLGGKPVHTSGRMPAVPHLTDDMPSLESYPQVQSPVDDTPWDGV